MRDLAQTCFRIAAAVDDDEVSRALTTFGNELMRELEPIAGLPDAREARGDHRPPRDRAPPLIVLSLADIRRLMHKTQREIAAVLSVRRNAVSKLEQRRNLSVSSLRGYLGAMGAELHLVASFPDHSRIFIENLGPKANH